MPEQDARVAGRSVIAVTTDDDRFAPVRRAAIDIARREDADLILYDWDAAMALGNPLPSVWSADGTDSAVPDRLDERELEAAGRDAIAQQVNEARRAGLHATAWLPSTHGPDALIQYARDHGATGIVIPAELADLGDDAAPMQVTVVPADESRA